MANGQPITGGYSGGERQRPQRPVAERVATLTEDGAGFLGQALDRIFGDSLDATRREEALAIARQSFGAYVSLFEQAFPARTYALPETQITAIHEANIRRILEANPNAVIILNDPHTTPNLEASFPDANIYRISTTRSLRGQNTGEQKSSLMARPGDLPLEEQLDLIEQKLREKGLSIDGAYVVIGDDVAVTGSTEEGIARLLEGRGAQVDRGQSLYIIKVFTGEYDEASDRPNSALVSKKRLASTEQRELGPLGGPVRIVGEHFALQQPAQYPWGDGGITRTNGFLNQQELSRQQLQLFLQTYGQIEGILKGAVRRDGTVFDHFTLADFRWNIPTGPNFRVSDAKRDHQERTGQRPHWTEVQLLRYVELALEQIPTEPHHITHVVEDLDGTVLRLRYPDALQRTMPNSELGAAVSNGFVGLLREYFTANGQSQSAVEQALETIDLESPVEFLKTHPDFARFLEDRHGVEVMQTLRQRFIDFYGSEQRGESEMRQFLNTHKGLPVAYHVMREYTWGQADLNTVYESDRGEARAFSTQVLDNGGTLIFLTAGPRIHAMRMLQATGQADLVISGRAKLITVEDLYDEGLVERKKSVVFENLIAQGINPEQIVGIGDQPHSDAKTAIDAGCYGFVVGGPEDLARVFEYATISTVAEYKDAVERIRARQGQGGSRRSRQA